MHNGRNSLTPLELPELNEVQILSNLLLLNLGLIVLGLQRVFYGPLRPIEVEQLYEKAWFAITETCLAMTIFRDDLGAWFIVLLVSLLVGKIWSWIGEGRVEILEQQPPANPRLFHTRLASSLALSVIFDLWFLDYTIGIVRELVRPNMIVMFAFEFAVLSVNSLSTCIRYCISLREMAVTQKQLQMRRQERIQQIAREREQSQGGNPADDRPVEEEVDDDDIDVPGWEDKGRWIFYLDLATDFVRLVLYLTFFCVLCVFYGMPIHIIRDVAITIRSFYKRISDFVKYRQATHDMNERYPDATAQEIGVDNVCIICREPMRVWEPPAAGAAGETARPDDRLRPKKLPCGHVLHFACLRSWLERQQNCPTCRQTVLVSQTPRSGSQGNPGAQGANAGNGGGPLGGHQRPGADENRIRFFNFGPLRLGFGAGPDFNRLAQQLQNPQAPQGQQGVQQQIGFMPQGRLRPNGQSPPASTSNQIRSQIELIEQQLIQEVNNLRVQTQELATVRALLNELARLRLLNQGATAQPARPPAQDPTGPIGLPPLPRVGSAPVQMHGAQEAQVPPNQFPEGLTLPNGWSLIPLQRMNAGTAQPSIFQQAPGPSSQDPPNNPVPNLGASHQSTAAGSQPSRRPATNAPSSGAVRNGPSEVGAAVGRAVSPPERPRPQASEVGPSSGSGPGRRHSGGIEIGPPPQYRRRSVTPSRVERRDQQGSESSSRKADTLLNSAHPAGSSSTARENASQSGDGLGLPKWRSHATTVEDAEDD